MVTISTRQNAKGNWWCNTTYNCYDISVEGETIIQAELLIQAELRKRGYTGEINWEQPKPYSPVPSTLKGYISAATWRIDKGMV